MLEEDEEEEEANSPGLLLDEREKGPGRPSSVEENGRSTKNTWTKLNHCKGCHLVTPFLSPGSSRSTLSDSGPFR